MMPTPFLFATLTVVFEVTIGDHGVFLRFRQLVGGLCSLVGRISVICLDFYRPSSFRPRCPRRAPLISPPICYIIFPTTIIVPNPQRQDSI
ncbi:unnamed protein product [Dibothriocephalus latus]|uniref:Uncharacterized protein n=1 Tax=Dibothriocephalus latus TaxID=60516 RepID=A0A3P7P8U1_DIBLA|nr:unnamed protein product [Dibothriocephalus latus]